MSGNLRDVSRRRHRDPSGKAALFSHGSPPIEPADGQPREEASEERKAATLVVECSACDTDTRVNYLDFILLNLPFALWLPLPGLRFNHRMTCPACGEWTWLRANWLG